MIVTAKYDRALKLHILSWIDLDIIKAGEMAALTTLELALNDRYGDQVGIGTEISCSTACSASWSSRRSDRREALDPAAMRLGVARYAADRRSQADPRQHGNDLAHGYPFDGLPSSGLLEVVRDLINYAYRVFDRGARGFDPVNAARLRARWSVGFSPILTRSAVSAEIGACPRIAGNRPKLGLPIDRESVHFRWQALVVELDESVNPATATPYAQIRWG